METSVETLVKNKYKKVLHSPDTHKHHRYANEAGSILSKITKASRKIGTKKIHFTRVKKKGVKSCSSPG